MSGVPSGGNTWKNIAIGIFTTVAAYAIINFTGIGKKDQTKKIRKEATEKAWQSINDYINYADQKFKTIACFSCDEQEMKKEMLRELDNYSAKLTNIKEDKNVDDKMLSIVDIIRQRFLDMKEPISRFYDSITASKSLSMEERLRAGPRLQQQLNDGIAKVTNRDTSEMQHFLQDVNKTFKVELGLNALKENFDSSAIARKWKIECAFEIDIKKDGSITWTENENNFTGKWKLDDKELEITLDNGQVFHYNILQLGEKFMLIDTEINGTRLSMGACPK
jgi:hypothetical protein